MGAGRRAAARLLTRSSHFLLELVPAVLRPDDFLALAREAYDRERAYDRGLGPAVEQGLSPQEAELIDPLGPGSALCVGCGPGRELVALARRGFKVVGTDWSAGQVERARARLHQEWPDAEVVQAEADRLPLEGRRFDLVCLLGSVYAHVPGRPGRVRLLREVGGALAPAGAAVLDFYLDPAARRARTFPLVKAAAWVTGGHRAIEAGDVMLADVFLHRHRDADQLAGEVRESGLVADHVVVQGHRGWTRLRRP